MTFKDQSGKPLQTVRRPTLRTGPEAGTRKVTIPDNTKTVDISVTTANGRTATRTGVDVALIKTEIVIDVPGGAPPQTAGRSDGSRAPGPRPCRCRPHLSGRRRIAGCRQATWTRIPQVSGGTRFGGGGVEKSIVDSKRTIPGVSASAGIELCLSIG